MRVLLIAEACNPEWESVPLVGYNWFRALSSVAEVTLVTQVRNRAALLRHAHPRDRVVFIDSERVARPFYLAGRLLTLGRGLGWTTRQAVMLAPYLYFEELVYRRLRRALAAGAFDLVHRLTPLSPTYPSPLASWTGVPFVLGPLNGGLPWPRGAARTRLAEMEFLSYARELYRLLPYTRATYQKAARVLAGSQYTLSRLPAAARRRAVYMPENGIDAARFHAHGRRPPSQIAPLRILFVGRLVPYKGADLVIEALAGSAGLRERAELVIVGDGPQRAALEAQVDRLGVRSRVCFQGRVPQAAVPDFFRAASVFAFPSLREFGGAVVMEAMACGLPSIVLAYGGPGELITPEIGIGLPLGERPARVSALRAALEHVLAHPHLLDQMSAAGAQRAAREFTWPHKAARVAEEYARVLRERGQPAPLRLHPAARAC